MPTKALLRTIIMGLAVAVPCALPADDKPSDQGPRDKEQAGKDAPPEGKGPDRLFRELDKNGDGKLSPDEITPEHKRHFEHLLREAGKKEGDTLTHEEFLKALQPEKRRFDMSEMGGGRRNRGGGDFNPGQMFDRWDKNKDGKVTKDELPEPARERLQPLFDRLQKDSFTREEFMKNRERFGGGGGGGNPEQFFKRLDKDSDGKLSRDEVPNEMRERFDRMLQLAGKKSGDSLTREEFQKNLGGTERRGIGAGIDRRMSIPDADEFLKRFDKNGDGKVTLEEVDGDLRRGFEQMQKRLKKEPDEGLSADDLRKLRDQEVAQGGDRRPGGEPGGRRPDGDGDRRRPEMNEEGRGDGDRPGRPLRFPQESPLLKLLDANHDGKITKDEISRIGELFDKLDANHDGQLDPWELMGPPPQRRDRNFGGREMSDRDGGDRRRETRDEEMREGDKKPGDDRRRPNDGDGGGRRFGDGRRIFERQDSDKDGKISKEEAFGPLKKNFEKLDANHDGFLDREEVRKGMQEMRDSGEGPFGRERRRDGEGKKPDPEKKEGDKPSE